MSTNMITSPALHCAGCGQAAIVRRKLVWPKNDPIFCSKDCAAGFAYAMATAGDGHCLYCGELGCMKDHEDE